MFLCDHQSFIKERKVVEVKRYHEAALGALWNCGKFEKHIVF